MPVIPPSETEDRSLEPQFLLNWDEAEYRPHTGRMLVLSVVVHLVIALLLWVAPREMFQVSNRSSRVEPMRVAKQFTPLVAPPFELTQKEKNKGEVKKEINLEDLTAPQQQKQSVSSAAPAPARPQPKAYQPPPQQASEQKKTQQQIEAPPEVAPKTETKELAAAGQTQTLPPELKAPEKRSPFETPGQNLGQRNGALQGRIPEIPKANNLEDIMRNSMKGVASGGGSGVTVSDGGDNQLSGIGSIQNPNNPRNKTGSSLELLSDPMGVDFRPYMAKVLSIIRRNWFAVIPESARFGRRGRTMIQFAISRDGRIPKLVISGPSGTEALDRAAVAGVSASNPLPPLPAEFKGDVIRLQFAFSYNMQ